MEIIGILLGVLVFVLGFLAGDYTRKWIFHEEEDEGCD